MITSIEINNYKSCINTKFSVTDNLSTLIGVNGVGKSNILYGLQLFTKPSRSRYYDEEESELFETQISLTFTIDNKTIYLKSKFFYSTDEKNIDEVSYSEMKYRIEGENSRKWNNIDPDIVDFVHFSKRRKYNRQPAKVSSDEAKLIISFLDILTRISYYSATQFSDPSKCPLSIDLDDIRRVLPQKEFLMPHQKFIYDLYKASQNEDGTSFALYINMVGSTGLNLIEDIDFHVHAIPSSSYKVKTGGKIQKIENRKQVIVPSFKIDGLVLSPNQLSEGTFKTLALIFYILTDNNSILLIEEPEVCVHHGLLRSIIELIKHQSHKKQIIISTHSDYILDMLTPENILLVKKESLKGTVVNPITKIMSKNDYNVLKEYLDSSGNLGEYWKEGGFDND